MPFMNPFEILETLHMLEAEKLDIRTITMGISLRDCADHDGRVSARAHLSTKLPAAPTGWWRWRMRSSRNSASPSSISASR